MSCVLGILTAIMGRLNSGGAAGSWSIRKKNQDYIAPTTVEYKVCHLNEGTSAGRRTQKLTPGEPSCAICLYLGVFCFLYVQKWNGYRLFGGIMFVGLRQVLWGRTQKLTTGEPSCAIFLYLGVFCFLFVRKWNGY
jgi:hypothetical protein